MKMNESSNIMTENHWWISPDNACTRIDNVNINQTINRNPTNVDVTDNLFTRPQYFLLTSAKTVKPKSIAATTRIF
jgi:hypothetical protein